MCKGISITTKWQISDPKRPKNMSIGIGPVQNQASTSKEAVISIPKKPPKKSKKPKHKKRNKKRKREGQLHEKSVAAKKSKVEIIGDTSKVVVSSDVRLRNEFKLFAANN